MESLIDLLHLYLGSAFNLPLKPLLFLYILDWHPSQKIELGHTPPGCFLESLSECRFLLQIIILVFPMFALRPLASRCFFFHKYSLQSSSSLVSAIITRSSAYKSSHGKPVWNSRDNATNTIMNNRGLRTEP